MASNIVISGADNLVLTKNWSYNMKNTCIHLFAISQKSNELSI